jgi:hypothetical protein
MAEPLYDGSELGQRTELREDEVHTGRKKGFPFGNVGPSGQDDDMRSAWEARRCSHHLLEERAAGCKVEDHDVGRVPSKGRGQIRRRIKNRRHSKTADSSEGTLDSSGNFA